MALKGFLAKTVIPAPDLLTPHTAPWRQLLPTFFAVSYLSISEYCVYYTSCYFNFNCIKILYIPIFFFLRRGFTVQQTLCSMPHSNASLLCGPGLVS